MLEDLLNEIDATVARLDSAPNPTTPEEGVRMLMSELKNTILPLVKDVAASTMLDLMEMRDIVDPIKLNTSDAEEIEALLMAFSESRAGDPGLQARISDALAALERGDDEEEPEAN